MFYIGLDLGQRRDHTAIVIVERNQVRRAYLPPLNEAMVVRHLERVPLGTPYPLVVERLREIVNNPQLHGICSLTVDGTGVGAPVVEMLHAARLGCEIRAVTITGGEAASRSCASGREVWSVPKQDLIMGVHVLLEQGELKIVRRMNGVGSLVKELTDMRMRRGHTGKAKMGAEGYGEHDDLVIALALACWSANRKKSGFGTQRLPGI